MRAVYLESSAALAWLLGEPVAPRIIAVIDQAKSVVTSLLTLVEVKRGLVRREGTGALTRSERGQLIALLTETAAGWELVGFPEEIQARAGLPFPVEPVRTLDALHLATALELLKSYPDLQVMTLDRRILNNLESLGLLAVKVDP